MDEPTHTPLDDRIDNAETNAGDTEEPQVFRVARPGGRREFLQTLSKGAAVSATAAIADGCAADTPPAPTPTTTSTSVRTTTTSTSTSTTTTTISANNTLAGVVTDEATGRPIVGGRVTCVDGPNANKSSPTDGNGYYSIPGLVGSSFTARATASGYNLADKGLTITRDTRLDFILRPVNLTTSSTTTSVGGGGGGCSCNSVHYWYPN